MPDNLKTGVIKHPREGEIVLNDAYRVLPEGEVRTAVGTELATLDQAAMDLPDPQERTAVTPDVTLSMTLWQAALGDWFNPWIGLAGARLVG